LVFARIAGIPLSMRRVIFLLLALCLFFGCSRPAGRDSEISAVPCTRAAVWTALQPSASRYRIEPSFIFALAAAESDFNPRAKNGSARGLLQLSPAAWKMVSDLPYDSRVEDWKTNLVVGIDYLAYLRSRLRESGHFSFPLWAASFHYGLARVAEAQFSLDAIPPPENEIYRALWQGNLRPVPPPS
jgi:soluble lytic murein transglycosylase-like protein